MHRQLAIPQPFAELGLDIPILKALAAMGFKEPSPIQRELVPRILAGRDVLGQARTGTGKTAAFGMPTLQMVDPAERLQVMVLTPTRELAAQVVGEFRRLAQFLPIRCVPVYGGTRMRGQLQELGRRPHVVVGTPGRVQDVIRRGALSLDTLRFVILDEVDRMLDIGFREDIQRILGGIRQPHQTILVSATISPEINRLARNYMNDPVEINVSQDDLTVEDVSQHYCVVDAWDKFRLLRMILEGEKPELAIVFCNTKHGARKLAKRLHAIGVPAMEIHGDLVQEKRERVMERFRRHKIPVLVATDLAARGIDVSNITHIINYDLPQDIEVYVHRIGRTARMGATGKAITFVQRDEGAELSKIEQLINKEIARLEVAGFEPSPPPREAEPSGIPRAAPSAALTTVAASATQVRPASPPPRTLGGKFPVPRRFRRR